MKITSKGQVTIPQSIRERAGLLPHTEIDFVISGKKVIIVKSSKVQRRGKKLLEAMIGAGTVKMSTDEIMALTRGE